MSSLNEALQQVPWAQFSHAYGSATDTPSHLLALFSNEVEEREKALSQLWISICHQGSVYEASAVAVPFLIQILQEVPDEQKPYYSLDCHSLSCLGVPLGLQGLINVLEQGASRWSILDTVRVAEAVLDVAFFGCWVENRYWNYTSVDYSFSCTNYSVNDEFLSFRREEISPLDDENAYFQLEYSRSSSSFKGFLITVFGYDKSEAAKLKLRYEQEGIQALLAYQRDALQSVLRCRPLWRFKHNLLEIYGLPTSQEELARLL